MSCSNCNKNVNIKYEGLISCKTCSNSLCEDCFRIIIDVNDEYFVNRFKENEPDIYEQELEEINEYWIKYYNMLYNDKEDNSIYNFLDIDNSRIYVHIQCNKCIDLEKLKSKIKKLEKDYNELKLFSLYDKKLNSDIMREITKFF